MSDIGKAYVQIVPSAKGIGGTISSALDGEATSAGKSAGNLIAQGISTGIKAAGATIAAATSAVVGFAASSVKAGAQFDTAMSQVAATMGKTVADMENEIGTATISVNGEIKEFSGNLREFAEEMGRNTAFSATEAAEALNYMALAGYDTQTAMSMLPNVLNLAAAGSMDLARASDMVTDTQTAFGISLERTSQMVDEMAKAASTGNTSVEQLGDAFLVVGGLAKELNGGMITLADGTSASVDGVQELEIALTAMANAGIKGNEAGTHMRNMLLKLSSPTSDGTKQLEALGVSVFDTAGNMRSLSDIFGDLSGAMSNLTQAQKLQAISDLFNTRDIASAEALLSAVGQDWDKIGESILDSAGAAQLMADTQLDNLAGDVTLFKSALEGLQIAISDSLTPTLREFVQFGTDGIGKLTEAFSTDGLSGAMDVFGELLSEALGKIIEVLPKVVSAGAQLIVSFAKGIRDNLNTILLAAGDIMESLLKGMLQASYGGRSIILDVISDILGVFEENYMNFIDMGAQILINMINGLSASAPDVFNHISEILGHLTQVIIEYAPKFLEAATNWAATLAQGIADALPMLIIRATEIIIALAKTIADPSRLETFIEVARNIVGAIIEGLSYALPALIATGTSVIGSFISGIAQMLPDIIPIALEMIGNIRDTIVSNIPTIMETATTLISGFLDGISTALPTMVPYIIQIITQIADTLISNIASLIEVALTIINSLANGIIEALPVLVPAVLEIISGIANTLLENITSVIEIAVSIITTLAEGLFEALPQLMPAVLGIITAIGEVITDNLSTVVGFALEIINTIVSGIIEALPELVPAAIEIINNIVSALIENISLLVDAAIQIMTSFVEAFVDALPVIIPAAIDIIMTLVDALIDNLDSLLDAALEIILALADGIINALPDLIPAVIDIVLKIVEKLTEPDTLTMLIEAAVNLILALADGLIKAIPKLIEALPTIITNLVKGFIQSIPVLIQAGVELIKGLIQGLLNMGKAVSNAAGQLFDSIKGAIGGKLSEAWQWGKDLISNLVNGILGSIGDIWDAMSNVAGTISSFLHFSEPDVGPLSNFHTFAPDMIDLFIKGISDNEADLKKQISTSFDFEDTIVNAGGLNISADVTGEASGGIVPGNVSVNVYGTEGQNEEEIAQIVADKINSMFYRQQAAFA